MGIVVLGIISNSIQALEGAILLSVAHGCTSSGLFICLGGIIYSRYHTRNINYMRGFVLTMPVFTLLLFLFILSNMGVPLSLNFLGEFLALTGIFEKNPIIGVLAALGIVFSAIYSIFNYNKISYGSFSNYLKPVIDIDRREFMLLLPLFLGTFILGFIPNIVLDSLHLSVSNILYHISYLYPFSETLIDYDNSIINSLGFILFYKLSNIRSYTQSIFSLVSTWNKARGNKKDLIILIVIYGILPNFVLDSSQLSVSTLLYNLPLDNDNFQFIYFSNMSVLFINMPVKSIFKNFINNFKIVIKSVYNIPTLPSYFYTKYIKSKLFLFFSILGLSTIIILRFNFILLFNDNLQYFIILISVLYLSYLYSYLIIRIIFSVVILKTLKLELGKKNINVLVIILYYIKNILLFFITLYIINRTLVRLSLYLNYVNFEISILFIGLILTLLSLYIFLSNKHNNVNIDFNCLSLKTLGLNLLFYIILLSILMLISIILSKPLYCDSISELTQDNLKKPQDNFLTVNADRLNEQIDAEIKQGIRKFKPQITINRLQWKKHIEIFLKLIINQLNENKNDTELSNIYFSLKNVGYILGLKEKEMKTQINSVLTFLTEGQTLEDIEKNSDKKRKFLLYSDPNDPNLNSAQLESSIIKNDQYEKKQLELKKVRMDRLLEWRKTISLNEQDESNFKKDPKVDRK
jgi:hypothetical protein